MKKVILSILVTMGMVIVLPAVASAAPLYTSVSGTVRSSGTPVPGANVTVTCDGNSDSVTANPAGQYDAVFVPASKCPDGSTATVTASKGGVSGINTGKVLPEGVGDGITVNVAIVDVQLPELGVITSIGAAVLGGAAFLVIRRRNVSDIK